MSEKSGHLDTFTRDALPPPELWPEMRYDRIPELRYPPRLNCAYELLDAMVEDGFGDRTVFHFPGGTWTYTQLLEYANQIARVLVDDLGVVPGNRVLLRGFNGPRMAACWFAVLKAGGVVVCTMPLLRTRELRYIADKARITLALCDARIAGDCVQAMQTRADGSPRADGRCVTFGAEGDLDRLMRGKPTTFLDCDTAADDVALIAFTSGTTGEGKGTMHFHRDVLAICDCFPTYVLEPGPDDIFCGSPPFAFTFGLGGLVLFPDARRRERGAARAGVTRAAAGRHRAVSSDDLRSRRRPRIARCSACSSRRSTTSRACGSACRRARRFRARRSRRGSAPPGSASSTASAPPRCCTSSSAPRATISGPDPLGRVVPGYEARSRRTMTERRCPTGRSGSSPCADRRDVATSSDLERQRGLRPERLEPHRRLVHPRRGRLLLVPGAHRRHDHLGGLQHLGPRGGERAAGASVRA